MRKFILTVIMACLTPIDANACERPRALVYRGPAACSGCPESVGHLLKTSPYNFQVTYVGPHEKVDVSEETLKGVTVYAHPGGPDLDDAWSRTKQYKKAIRDFVSSGGHYMGFCLGAYLAGETPGYGLLPTGADTDTEISQHNAQVKNEDDTVIQIDWDFVNGRSIKGRWAYFQDGVVIKGLKDDGKHGQRIIGRYSKNGDVAAAVVPFGRGWVGLVGPHPEATQDWCKFKFQDIILVVKDNNILTIIYSQMMRKISRILMVFIWILDMTS